MNTFVNCFLNLWLFNVFIKDVGMSVANKMHQHVRDDRQHHYHITILTWVGAQGIPARLDLEPWMYIWTFSFSQDRWDGCISNRSFSDVYHQSSSPTMMWSDYCSAKYPLYHHCFKGASFSFRGLTLVLLYWLSWQQLSAACMHAWLLYNHSTQELPNNAAPILFFTCLCTGV